MQANIVYFEKTGSDNTEEVLRVVKQRADQLGIKTVVIASTKGATAVKALKVLGNIRIIAVSHSSGWHAPNTQEFTEENRKMVESKGGIVLTAAHAFGGVGKAMLNIDDAKMSGIGEIIANTLRTFSQGMKVACEITLMAADGGLVRTDEDVIAIAGTGTAGGGSDTAIVVRPVNSTNFFDLKIREILCKPHY